MTSEEITKIRQKALGLVLPHFPGAQIVAIRDASLQDSQKGLEEAPSLDKKTPKLPKFLQAAKRSASS